MERYVGEPEGVSLFNTVSKGYFACKNGEKKVKCDSSLEHKTSGTKIMVSRAKNNVYDLNFSLGCVDQRTRFLWLIPIGGKVNCHMTTFSAKVGFHNSRFKIN